MCGRIAQMLTWAELVALYRLSYSEPPVALTPRYNLAPTQDALVVRNGEGGERELFAMRWGLLPFWAKDESFAARTINARVETVDQKPSFREAFKSRRCLVPCSGWYEWRSEGGAKQPYLMRGAEAGQGTVSLAGIWERWQRGEREIVSFSILVGEAPESLAQVHHRAPAIIGEDDFGIWLDGETPKNLLLDLVRTPYSGPVSISRVSRRVNSPRNDDASLIQEVT